MKFVTGKFCMFLAAAIGLAWTGSVQAAQPWTAFGNAEAVKVRGDWVVALTSDVSATAGEGDAFAGVDFTPKKAMTFSEIKRLSADYLLAQGGAGGGSPRFQINIADENGDFVGNVFVYLGTYPNFDDDPSTEWQHTGNLVGTTELRVDTSQVGGTFYDDWAGAMELVGGAQVLGVQLVVDGGWAVDGDVQTVLVDDVRVNNFKLTGKNFGKE
jgi:hypothetical protein